MLLIFVTGILMLNLEAATSIIHVSSGYSVFSVEQEEVSNCGFDCRVITVFKVIGIGSPTLHSVALHERV